MNEETTIEEGFIDEHWKAFEEAYESLKKRISEL